MLQNGAAHVVALDVGHGQLDWKIRSDARVTVMERVNARTLTPDQLPDGVRQVDVTVHVKDPTEPWTKHEGMRRLNQLTNLIYDAISSSK